MLSVSFAWARLSLSQPVHVLVALEQVRALEKEMQQRLEEAGLQVGQAGWGGHHMLCMHPWFCVPRQTENSAAPHCAAGVSGAVAFCTFPTLHTHPPRCRSPPSLTHPRAQNVRADIVVLTRLIPDAQGTSCNERLEPISGCRHARILRVPFRDQEG